MPVTSSEFVYYGGFHIFSSAVFATTSSGAPPGIASTWLYYGGFHVFSNTPPSAGSTWQYWGGFHIFGSGPAASTSTGGVTAGRRLISPTGFKTAPTVVRF